MKRKVVLGMAVFMTAIMVPVQAFAAKPAGGGGLKVRQGLLRRL